MTEDEAKMKWCPQARVACDSGFSFNRWAGGEAVGVGSPTLCIASACMAWREGAPIKLASCTSDKIHHVKTGFCGLAGQPATAEL